MSNPQRQSKKTSDLMRYAGLGMQLFVSLGIAVFIGVKADRWLQISFPVFAWVLPLLVLCMMMYKLIRETSKQKKKDEK
jgi:hypothetical protein